MEARPSRRSSDTAEFRRWDEATSAQADVGLNASGRQLDPDNADADRCFLCAFTPRQPCDVARVEGRLARVVERAGADGAPLVTLVGDEGQPIDILLTRDERALASALAALPTERLRALTLRAFHLRWHAPGATDHIPDVAALGDGDDRDAHEEAHAARARHTRLQATPLSVIVLEPDLQLNITDINNAEYCVRQYPLRRMASSTPSLPTLRGTIIHQAFKELLKSGRSAPDDVAASLALAVESQATDLALRQISAETARAEAEPHLRALAAWYHQQRNTLWGSAPNIRTETLLLAPEVGLKGRLDALLSDAQGNALLELKTGQSVFNLPKREHRWQVYGYQTLLAVRRPSDPSRPGATLLYSGTSGRAEAYGIPFSLRELRRTLELRNLLALTHATGVVPAPPGGAKCGRCSLRETCQRASALLGWQAPPDESPTQGAAPISLPLAVDAEDAAWFARNYELMRLEAQAAEAQSATLWRQTPQARREAGIALGGLELAGEPAQTASGEWEYHFACDQTSELREGDAILLSDGDPIHGEIVTGSILSIGQRHVTVWAPERIANPRLLDRYESDIVHDRTVRNLWRWLGVDARLRALVAGKHAPEFDENGSAAAPMYRQLPSWHGAPSRASLEAGGTSDDELRASLEAGGTGPQIAPLPIPAAFNPEQRLAVERALAARDFLLIQGPPGTGKTSVVAEIARQAIARGERVLLAAFTNQAVDNALRRLLATGFDDFVRLGHALSVSPELHPYRLTERARALTVSALTDGAIPDDDFPDDAISDDSSPDDSMSPTGVSDALGADATNGVDFGSIASATERATDTLSPALLREALMRAPLVATTTATWSAERYDEVGDPLTFDLAIIDEATQLTTPALLGALRFAQRFVLVGDERQLAPLVMSEAAAAQGLKRSLFSELRERWGDVASLALRRQYRMHPVICGFPSHEFYGDALVAEGAALTATLDLPCDTDDPLALILDPQKPLVFVDTPHAAPAPKEIGGKVSATQATVAQRIVLALRAAGLSADRIGIIAPYRAQVAAIRQRLAARGETDVVVDTVDRFQGGEREVILFSFGGDAPLGAPGGHARDFLADPQRLNVALTRAQRKLILLGDRRHLEGFPLLKRLIAYCDGLYDGRGGVVAARYS